MTAMTGRMRRPAATAAGVPLGGNRGRGVSLRPPSSGGSFVDALDAGARPVGRDAPSVEITPIRPRTPANRAADIPDARAPGMIVDAPDGGTAVAAPPAASPAGESCGQPRAMQKVTAGAFLGGVTMDDYFPDLKGSGLYQHPGSGGAFDTGSRAGANIQLLGVIPSPCEPGQYKLEQTIKRTRFRINGSKHAEEGKTFDDIAKSRRDATKSPFRQELLGGGSAPLGYIISMADPPSTGYGATDTIDHDRDFVTSLVGPAGRQDVTWSLSTRIVNGRVTKNDLA